MKETIIGRLRVLFPKANLTKQRLDEIVSDKLIGRFSDESTNEEIDAILELLPINEIAKQDDKVRTLEARKQDSPKDNPKGGDGESDNEILKALKGLADRLDGIENEKKRNSLAERFNSDERIKDIPEFMRRGYIPTSEDDLEANIEALASEFKSFSEKNKLQNFGNDIPKDSFANLSKKEISPEDAKAIVSGMSD